MKFAVFALLMPWAIVVGAQSPAPAAPSAPPPLPAADATAVKPVAPPAKPRRAIELSPAERQAIDARELKAVKPASVDEALVPTPEDAKVEREENENTRALSSCARRTASAK